MLSWPALRTVLMFSLAAPLMAVAAALLLLAGWLAYLKVLAVTDPLKQLPGTNLGSVQDGMEGVEAWARSHSNAPTNGKTPLNLRLPGLFPFEGRQRLVTIDPKVINQILTSPNFEKPKESRGFLTKFLGKGIFAAEGAEHNMLRKAYMPAFAKTVTRRLEPQMMAKADRLCDIWSEELKNGPVDVQSTLCRAALDVVAALGFGEDVHAVDDKQHPIYIAYRRMLEHIEYGTNAFQLYLSLQFSWFHRVFPDQVSRTVDASRKSLLSIGRGLLQISASGKRTEKDDEVTTPSLLSAILRQSEHPDKLSDHELLGAISTFLFNGSDSVGSTIAWALHYLSLDQDFQQRLRTELGNADRAGALEDVPSLNHVVREILRLLPPLHSTIRIACKDEILHASEDIVLMDGRVVREFLVPKGCFIHVSIEPVNTLTDFWGQDAKEFNPDRWADIPETAPLFPGGHRTMAFTFGPHGCPASHIALKELHIFISTIVQRFELHPAADIGSNNVFMIRPYVRTKWAAEGVQLPIILKPVSL